jgi:hypothetical protein
MSRKLMLVLGTVLVVGSSTLGGSASATGSHYDGSSGALRGLSGSRGTATDDGYNRDGQRGSGAGLGHRDYEARDMWGHWGTYYGPMI